MRNCIIAILLIFSTSMLRGQEDAFLTGRSCMLRGEFELAVVHFEAALKSEPGNTGILLQQGICFLELDRARDAWKSFFEVERRKQGLASFYMAKTELRLNHPELALKYLREHLDSRYRRPEKEILLDPDLAKLEGSSGWQTLWNEKQWYADEEQLLQDALFMAEHEQELEALNQLNDLERKGFRESEVLFHKAEIYERLGNGKAAASSLEDALKSDTRNLDALHRLVPYQVGKGEYDEALNGLNRIIRSRPDCFEAYLDRADVYGRMDQIDRAEKDIDLYLDYFPESHNARYRKGMIRYNHGKYLDAIRSFNQALLMEQGEARYYFARGLAYAATGTTRYADRDMSMALDLDPSNGEFWFEKGKLQEEMGLVDAACRCYKKAYQNGVFEAGELVRRSCN